MALHRLHLFFFLFLCNVCSLAHRPSRGENSYVVQIEEGESYMVYEYSTDDGMKMKSVEKTGSMHLLMYRRGPKNSPSTNSRTELSMFAGARGTHCWKVTHHMLGEEMITRSDPQHSWR